MKIAERVSFFIFSKMTSNRRFGKSLNMSMLKSFFEIGCDSALDGAEAFEEGNAAGVEDRFNAYLKKLSASVTWL